MRKGQTVALHLYHAHIEVLDRLAARYGSRSAAVQHLLDEAKRSEIYGELEEAYRGYVGEPEAREADRGLTLELLEAASWPEEWQEGGLGGTESRRAKKSKAR